MEFSVSPASVLPLILLAVTLPLTIFYALRVRTGRIPAFRALPGIAALRARFSDVAESGRPLHIATGANQSNTGASNPTAETLASLLIAQRIAEETTRRGGKVAASSGDIVAHAALRGAIHNAYRQAGFGSDYRAEQVQLLAQNTPVAYAAGVAARYEAENFAASVVAGKYGAEALLIGEEGAMRDLPQVAAATSLDALPVLAISADATLIGEDLFAAEAYLSDATRPKARLLTHDALRWIIVVLLLAGIVWQLLAALMPNLGLQPLA